MASKKKLLLEEKDYSERRYLEPEYIQGPVNFIYIKGDAGDGVMRKILLLGDIHEPHIPCTLSEESISVADFCRYVANKNNTRVIDIFIEEFYPIGQERLEEYQFQEGNYLNNLCYDFKECLKKDKEQCEEPMRIHYIDPRFLNMEKKDVSSLVSIDKFLYLAYNGDFRGDIAEWPESEDIEKLARLNLSNAKLTNVKIRSIHFSIRRKFKNIVILPLLGRIIYFYRSKKNKDAFDRIKDMEVISSENKKIILKLRAILNGLRSYIMDAYFVYRLLKRAVYKGDRPEVALSNGEPITHVISYTGAAHVFHTVDFLTLLGFNIIAERDINDIEREIRNRVRAERIIQCLPYNSIKNSVDDFCDIADSDERYSV